MREATAVRPIRPARLSLVPRVRKNPRMDVAATEREMLLDALEWFAEREPKITRLVDAGSGVGEFFLRAHGRTQLVARVAGVSLPPRASGPRPVE